MFFFWLLLPAVVCEFHARTFDIVYTWVNGSDVFLLEQMKKVMPKSKVPTGRVQDREELRYSLRSIQQFMPWWEGRLIIFTNHEPPTWLNLSTPRVTVVSHPKVWENSSLLPTFNSDGIEHHLRNLPALTDHFLYFNDDMLLNAPVFPSHFWSETGRPQVRFTKNMITAGKKKHDELAARHQTMWQANIYFTHGIVDQYYPSGKDYFLHHTPYPMLKSVLDQIHDKFYEETQVPIHCRLRCYGSLQVPSMHHWVSVRQDLADPIWNTSALNQYVFVKTTDLSAFRTALGSIGPKTLFFNLADYPTSAGFREEVRKFLTKKYPHPSRFELADAPKTIFELEEESSRKSEPMSAVSQQQQPSELNRKITPPRAAQSLSSREVALQPPKSTFVSLAQRSRTKKSGLLHVKKLAKRHSLATLERLQETVHRKDEV